ncbi:lysostaphin resistance A-like protein [Stackebrandtia soli]|uniref:CPBP family intramembrane glutamic endopeptidase n=1 Tax=Stackebrandtia soli TaxID=1892856 RepID=UPI0039E8971E
MSAVVFVRVQDSPAATATAALPRLDWRATVRAVRDSIASHRRLLLMLAAILAALVVVVLVNRHGPPHAGLLVEPLAALGLVLAARRHGVSWHDLGLSRRTWLRGLAVAGVAILAVALLYAIAVAWPLTRPMFLDTRYQLDMGKALLTALVFIPLGTVLMEEIVFRGVLLGVVGKRSKALAILTSSVLFGAWHILPSLNMGGNQLIATIFGVGFWATVAVVAAVVVFTGLAGWLMCEIRRRSGSLIATAGLHWATNGLAVLLTSAVWALNLA